MASPESSSPASERWRSYPVRRSARQPPSRALGGQTLELGPHQIDVAALLGAERAHDGAAVAELVDEADRLQLSQRLAHRGAADTEAGRQVFLTQPRAQGDAAGDDLDLQLVGEVVGARQKRCVWRHTSDLNTVGCQFGHRCILLFAVWIQTG